MNAAYGSNEFEMHLLINCMFYSCEPDTINKLLSLIKEGTDINSCDTYELSPLYKSITNRSNEVSAILIKNGAIIDGKILFMIIDSDHMIYLLDLIFNYSKIDTKMLNTCVLRSEIPTNKLIILLDTMVNHNFDIDISDENGDNILHISINEQLYDKLDVLLNRYPQINALSRNRNNETVIDRMRKIPRYAKTEKYAKNAKNAKTEISDRSVIACIAEKYRYHDITKHLTNNESILIDILTTKKDRPNINNQTIYHRLLYYPEILSLVNIDTDVNKKDKQMNTPLDLALILMFNCDKTKCDMFVKNILNEKKKKLDSSYDIYDLLIDDYLLDKYYNEYIADVKISDAKISDATIAYAKIYGSPRPCRGNLIQSIKILIERNGTVSNGVFNHILDNSDCLGHIDFNDDTLNTIKDESGHTILHYLIKKSCSYTV